MKKMLSILSAMGLVAVASTSVVSCTKTSKQAAFNNLSDLKGNFVSDNQIIISKEPDIKEILGTIAGAGTFSNPEDIAKLGDVTIKETNDLRTDRYNTIIKSVVLSDADGKVNSGKIQIRVSTDENVTELSKEKPDLMVIDQTKYSVPVDLTGDITSLLGELTVNGNGEVDSKVKEEVKNNGEVYRIIQRMITSYSSYINSTEGKLVVPGYRNDSNVRYASNIQELWDLSNVKDKDGYSAYDDKVIETLANFKKSNPQKTGFEALQDKDVQNALVGIQFNGKPIFTFSK